MQQYGLQQQNKKSFLELYYYIAFMCFFALVAMQIATQNVAHVLQYQTGLGDYWFIALNMKWYAPWSIFYWSSIPSIEFIVDTAISYGQLAFMTPQVFALAVWLITYIPGGNKSLHGSAKFATEQQIKSMGYFNGKGVYVGSWLKGKGKNATQLYLRHNGPEHCLCFAPTRSGKGVGLILPTLLSWLGSSIVLDIKGENWALTSGYNKSQGNMVLRFDPSDMSGSGCKFNPIEEIRLDTLFAIQDVQGMAMMIVDADGKGLADHWTKAAFAFFSGVILHCCIMIHSTRVCL